jgi:hypothetical protein
MRRTARIGLGAGALAGVTAGIVKATQVRRGAKRERLLDSRRDLWPAVPVKPGAAAHIDAERVSPEGSDGYRD